MNPHACACGASLGSAGFGRPARFTGGELRSPKFRLRPPEGAAAVHGRLCTADRLRGREAMLRKFPATPLGTARREAGR